MLGRSQTGREGDSNEDTFTVTVKPEVVVTKGSRVRPQLTGVLRDNYARQSTESLPDRRK
jgi:hypothetical protein